MPGDANGDGRVDVGDLGILAASYGLAAGATLATGDFNGDGKVDISDLGILAANYGAGTGAVLDFNADTKALGLSEVNDLAEMDQSPIISGFGCDLAGLPLILGVFLMGLRLVKPEE